VEIKAYCTCTTPKPRINPPRYGSAKSTSRASVVVSSMSPEL